MVILTEAEIWAWNVLNATVANAQGELNRAVEARGAYIELLEAKYQAAFDPTTSQFTPRPSAEASPGEP